MEKAYALLAEMKEVGVEANSHCYNPLIMGFSTKVTLTLSSCMETSSFGKRLSMDCIVIFSSYLQVLLLLNVVAGQMLESFQLLLLILSVDNSF
jgi:hypothetical protein